MRAICCLLLLFGPFAAGCMPAKPVAWPQKTATIYPEPRPHNCKMTMLQEPPAEAHETIAQIWSYGNSREELPRMQNLIRFEACQIGAHAVILLPAQDVDHVNTFNAYPDWALEKSGFGQSVSQNRTDRSYSLSQVGFALIYKKDEK